MAGDQTLNVNITGDASDLASATSAAAKSLADLKGDIDKVDSETIEVTPEIELSRVRRDLASLNKTLDGLERRKANPDVDLDMTQLLRDEAKVRKAIDDLDRRKVEIEASIQPDTAGLARFTALVDDLDSSMGGLVPGMGQLAGNTGKLAGPAAAVGIALGAWKLGELAGDVETTQLQLKALTGTAEDGAEAFRLLQSFAADTPFAFDQVTAAARSLLAAGKDVGDLPQYLTDLGNVAAATGVPIEDLGVIFQQMLSKGKVSNEELLQLAERGVPAYQALADQLGVTVPEVQKMAEQGQIGAEQVDRLASSLGDLYPTAMVDQAGTFNGQMSTLKDTLTQTGQTLGTLVLPEMTDLTHQLTDAAEAGQQLGGALGWIDEKSRKTTGTGFVAQIARGFGLAGPSFDTFKDNMGAVAAVSVDTADAVAGAAAGIGAAVSTGLGDAAAEAEEARQAIEDAWAGGIDIRTRVNFLISQDDLNDAILKATTGAGAVDLPANLTVKGIGGLSEAQKTLVGDLSSFVQAGIEEGSRRAEVNPDFDSEAWNRRIFAQTRALTIKAGIDPSKVDKFLAHVLGLTPTIDVDGNTKPAWDDVIDFVTGKPKHKSVPVDADTDPAEGDVSRFVQRRTGKTVYVDADTSAAAAAIARLTVDQFVNIIPRVLGGGGGGGGGGDDSSSRSAAGPSAPGLLGASRAMADDPAFYYGPTGRARRRPFDEPPPARQLRPKQTPVAVYLDGAQIADQLALRTDRLATVRSVRREA